MNKVFMKFKFYLIIFLFFISELIYAHTISQREFILDTDMGIDDAIATLYLLKQPTIRIKAIVVEADGNAHCNPAFTNTMRLLKLMHRTEIPVACGRSTPLRGNHQFPSVLKKKMDTFADTLFLKRSFPSPNQKASDLVIAALHASSHPIDILAIGPLTTIAEVLEKQPYLKNKIHMIYFMGGAVHVPGNINDVDSTKNNRAAEWNIYFDPYAAKKVFDSKIPITLIPLDVTNQVPLDKTFYERIKREKHTLAATFVYELLTRDKQMIDNNTWYFWDPLAAVIAVHDSESVSAEKTQPLSIQLQPESLSGATIIDKQRGNLIRVCRAVDIEKFKDILLKGLN